MVVYLTFYIGFEAATTKSSKTRPISLGYAVVIPWASHSDEQLPDQSCLRKIPAAELLRDGVPVPTVSESLVLCATKYADELLHLHGDDAVFWDKLPRWASATAALEYEERLLAESAVELAAAEAARITARRAALVKKRAQARAVCLMPTNTSYTH